VLPIVLTEAVKDADFAAARVLFREYAAGLGVDLCFQGFEAELGSLPEMYGAPEGCLAAGESCEMKRLYVRAEARGTGLGRILAESLIAKGRSLGYAVMRLDTLLHMTAARELYRSLGFVEIAAYYDNPLPKVMYMELDLLAG
jgi:putative acetyltransferase